MNPISKGIIVVLLVVTIVVLALGIARAPDCHPVEECLPYSTNTRAEVNETTP